MKIQLRYFMTLLLMMVVSVGWSETKTEGFEKKSTGTDFQSTFTVPSTSSDCGIGWEIYYGAVSKQECISGKQSAAMRIYTAAKYGYLKTTTPIDNLTNVSFKAKASRANSATIKINISYSNDGSTWTLIKSDMELSSSANIFSFDIPVGGRYFQIAISPNSKRPSSKSAQLTIDDVVFTYNSVTLAPSKAYTTLTSAYGLDFTNVTGLAAFIVKAEDVKSNSVKLTQVQKVPANTGLVLQKTGTEASYSIPVFDGTDADNVIGNLMYGSATEEVSVAAESGYILKDGKFHLSEAGTLAKGKAYLRIVNTEAKELNITFGESTGINNVNENDNESGKIFNLAGQQMKSAVKGVYIKNGKKYIK